MTLPTPPHRILTPGLTGTLRGFYYAAAAIAAAAVFALINEARAFDTWSGPGGGGTLSALARAEESRSAIEGFLGLATLVIVVLTIIWWYQAARAIEHTTTAGRTWTPGWAIGGWFIPFANLVIPKLVLNQIDRVSGAADEGTTEWKERRVMSIIHAWWVFWLAAVLLRGFGIVIAAAQLAPGAILDPVAYASALKLQVVGMGAIAVAALFAAASLRVLGNRLHR